MRVPLQWLADYVDHELTTDELADRLTMTGLKVESIERPAAEWRDVLVGQVVEMEPHPRSRNPLNVARVDLGGRTITVVTGAPNVRAGDKVPAVLVGGTLPHGPDGKPMTIVAKPMAGITSEGMLCSARELGISDEHTGLYILPPDTPVGVPLGSVMGEDVLEIETVSNRPDTLSIVGVAREVAAITEQQLTLPDVTAITGDVEWLDEESIPVRIEAPDLCPRYSALRIEGVRVEQSPSWLASRLEAAGMRPINSLVDITNYVMLEYGQPMHAFDAARLHGGEIVVRRAREGERLRTLDGVERTLTPEALVIADGARAVAVAGVMGGEDSEIRDDTTAIVLESATFNAPSVRFTAKALGLRTEASSRFEKGLQPESTVPALMRFLQLLAQVSEGPLRVARVSDAYVQVPRERVVRMPLRDLERLVGVEISAETAAESLSLLGFGVTVEDEAIAATVPFWRRVDIEQSADLVEEVARLVGFDTLPSTLPRRTMPLPVPAAGRRRRDVVRGRLLAAGASEVTTHSLTSPGAMARLALDGNGASGDRLWAEIIPNPRGIEARGASMEPVCLQNPATTDRQMLRLTLLPSVLDVAARNLRHTEERLAFFELDRTFFRRAGDLPYERETLAIALSGVRRPRGWDDPKPGPYSFYDLKGMVEAVMHALRIRGAEFAPAHHPALHPGRAAALRVGGHEVGYLGELHPEVAARFELASWPVQAAEIDLDALFEAASDVVVFRPLPRYPAAYRDIAAVVDREVPAEDVMRVVRSRGGEALEFSRIFDVYEGAQLPPGKKSLAVEMVFRSPDATLTQEEVSEVMGRIIDGLQAEVGATLRD